MTVPGGRRSTGLIETMSVPQSDRDLSPENHHVLLAGQERREEALVRTMVADRRI